MGFGTPLALLSACHDRIARQCATFQRLAAYVTQHGSDSSAQTAAASLLRYFDTAAVLHHRDEEEDLFPALIESMAGSDAACIHALVNRLTQEHRRLEVGWQELRIALVAVSAGQPAELNHTLVDAFCACYATHIRCEEDELLPIAARLLDDAVLLDMSLAMQSRRGGGAS